MKLNHILLASVLVLAACSVGSNSDAGVSSSSTASSEPNAMMQASSRSSGAEASSVRAVSSSSSVSGAMEAASSAPGASARVIEITAENFEFTPSVIRVKKGEKVILRVKGQEGIHGFGIAKLGVNERVELGATIDIELGTETTGTFDFRCTVPCGPGHKDMVGQIIIE